LERDNRLGVPEDQNNRRTIGSVVAQRAKKAFYNRRILRQRAATLAGRSET